jgi:hypothetical protein
MDYLLKLGVVVDSRHLLDKAQPTYGPNYFQVKVLPDMNDINDKDVNGNYLLPRYPNFFKNNDICYQPGDPVWLVCDDDYHVGFILGPAQPPAGEDITSFIALINNAELNADMEQSAINEISIQKLSDTYITFSNVSTGTAGQIYNTNIVYLYGSDGSIYCTNGNFTLTVSSVGDVYMGGKSVTQYINGDHSLDANGSTENLSSKRIDASGMITLNSGGGMSLVTGASPLSIHTSGDFDSIVGKTYNETVVGSCHRTVMLGTDAQQVLAGSYTIAVQAGVITLACSGPLTIASPTSIALETLVLDLSKCDTITLPINPLQGFATGVPPGTSPIGFMVMASPIPGVGAGTAVATFEESMAL